MSAFGLTPRALKDLDAIADYTLENWGAGQMETYLRALNDRFQWLADNPMLGRDRNDVGRGFRSFRQGAHLIFYIVSTDGIHIIGVPHASMDIDAYFNGNLA